jgi:hypothetical protein
LRYRSSSSSSYKWEFIGGPPLNAQDWNSRTTTSTTLTDLTGQPSITVPLAGDYLAFHRFYGNNSNAANFAVGMIVNNTTDEAEASTASATAGNNQQPSVEKRITVTTANHVVKVRNRVAPGGTGQFIDRYLSLLPVRVG